MALSLGGRRRQHIAEINVTPFVDVMLVLLTIFMVTAPMMLQGVDVALPQTQPTPMKASEEVLVLTVAKDHRIYLDRSPVALPDLKRRLTKMLEARTAKDLLFRADREVPYGVVVRVMAEVREAGVTSLGMVTEPLNGSP